MEIFASVLAILTLACITSGEKTITCPSCTHVDSDLIGGAFNNEACAAVNFNPNHPDIDTTTCTASGTQVAKCVKFSGEISFEIPVVGTQTINTYIRDCVVDDSNPGNICEQVSGDQDSTTFIAQTISNILSVLSFFGGDDTFDGQLCYYDEHASDATHLHVGLLAILIHFAVTYLIVVQ